MAVREGGSGSSSPKQSRTSAGTMPAPRNAVTRSRSGTMNRLTMPQRSSKGTRLGPPRSRWYSRRATTTLPHRVIHSLSTTCLNRYSFPGVPRCRRPFHKLEPSVGSRFDRCRPNTIETPPASGERHPVLLARTAGDVPTAGHFPAGWSGERSNRAYLPSGTPFRFLGEVVTPKSTTRTRTWGPTLVKKCVKWRLHPIKCPRSVLTVYRLSILLQPRLKLGNLLD